MTTTRVNLMQHAVSSLVNTSHSNTVSVLNFGWNTESQLRKAVHSTILNALATLYTKNPDDQTKLTKILEIAHELKPNGLTELFNLPHLNFTIDLACLASKRDFLKLEKWLEDKHAELGVGHERGATMSKLLIIRYVNMNLSNNLAHTKNYISRKNWVESVGIRR